jgi:hypothetical protein
MYEATFINTRALLYVCSPVTYFVEQTSYPRQRSLLKLYITTGTGLAYTNVCTMVFEL